jgi:hypothetical protein
MCDIVYLLTWPGDYDDRHVHVACVHTDVNVKPLHYESLRVVDPGGDVRRCYPLAPKAWSRVGSRSASSLSNMMKSPTIQSSSQTRQKDDITRTIKQNIKTEVIVVVVSHGTSSRNPKAARVGGRR